MDGSSKHHRKTNLKIPKSWEARTYWPQLPLVIILLNFTIILDNENREGIYVLELWSWKKGFTNGSPQKRPWSFSRKSVNCMKNLIIALFESEMWLVGWHLRLMKNNERVSTLFVLSIFSQGWQRALGAIEKVCHWPRGRGVKQNSTRVWQGGGGQSKEWCHSFTNTLFQKLHFDWITSLHNTILLTLWFSLPPRKYILWIECVHFRKCWTWSSNLI